MQPPSPEDRSPEGRSPEERRLLREAVRRFVRRELWLWEKRIDPNAFALPPEVAAGLRPKVAAMGLSLLREPEALGGPPIDGVTRALVLEDMAQHRAGVLAPGYGLFGPQAPPALYACTAGQRQRFLLPLLRGGRRCFVGLHDPWLGAPTESDDGGGLRIRARRTSGGWLLDGTKLFVADAGRDGEAAADFGVVHARAEDESGLPLGAACFIVETERAGFQRWRPYPTLATGRDTQELNLSNLRLPSENRLGDGPVLAPDAHARHDACLAAQLTGVGRAARSMLRERARAGDSESTRWALADADVNLRARRRPRPRRRRRRGGRRGGRRGPARGAANGRAGRRRDDRRDRARGAQRRPAAGALVPGTASAARVGRRPGPAARDERAPHPGGLLPMTIRPRPSDAGLAAATAMRP